MINSCREDREEREARRGQMEKGQGSEPEMARWKRVSEASQREVGTFDMVVVVLEDE